MIFGNEPGIINKNQRVYDNATLDQQISKVNKGLSNIRFIGEKYHPM
jgi:hypothetical protein